eukprot:3106653-Prymnesium_polylepis.1
MDGAFVGCLDGSQEKLRNLASAIEVHRADDDVDQQHGECEENEEQIKPCDERGRSTSRHRGDPKKNRPFSTAPGPSTSCWTARLDEQHARVDHDEDELDKCHDHAILSPATSRAQVMWHGKRSEQAVVRLRTNLASGLIERCSDKKVMLTMSAISTRADSDLSSINKTAPVSRSLRHISTGSHQNA